MFAAYWVLYNKKTKEFYTGSNTTKVTQILWDAQKYCEKHTAEQAKSKVSELVDFEPVLT